MAKISHSSLKKILSSEIHTRQLEDRLVEAVEMASTGSFPIIGLLYTNGRAFSVEVRDALNSDNAIIPEQGRRWEPALVLW